MTERFPGLAALARKLSAYWRPWIACWAVIGTLAAAAVALGPLEGVPHVQDEVVYQFQARLLAQGRLWEEELLPRAAHHYEFVINADGRRYGVFPQGWPALLAIGVLLGVPFLVNPLLHGATVVAGAWLALRTSGKAAAFLAAPLLSLSPALLIQGASRMSHVACGLLALLATGLVLTGEPRRGVALLAGGAVGWVWLTRPLDGLVLTLVLGVATLWTRRARSLRHALIPIALAILLLGLLNLVLEGSPWRFPQTAWFARGEPPHPGTAWRYSSQCNDLGFGPGHGCMPVWGVTDHSITRGIEHSWLNWKLAGSLWYGAWPLALLSAAAWLERSARPLLLTCLGLFLALTLGYSAYWFHGACYGPRFLHSAAPMALVVFAIGSCSLARRVRVPVVLGLLLLLAFAERMPAVLSELRGYWGVDGRLERLEQRWDRGPALMFVAYGGGRPNIWRTLPQTSEPLTTYPATLRRAMWFDRSSVLLKYAEYQPRLVDEIVRRWPGRRAYVMVLHDQRKLDYFVPLETLPRDERQVRELPVPQLVPFLFEPLSGGTSLQRYYDP